jgi:hypothetical protein
MLNNLKSALSRNFTNALGWKTDRKIIVIESDDWGSIRMPNNKVRETFIKKGYNLGDNPYCKYDTLANSDDLNALFDVLKKHKDLNNNHPKFTFNTVVANPDFQKIENSNFDKYFYEPFTTTLKNYYPKEDVFGLWKEGIDAGLIKPQFHGREHVNVNFWLSLLNEGNNSIMDAFKLGFWGVPSSFYNSNVGTLQAAFRSSNKNDIEFFKENIVEGVDLFKKIFKTGPTSFIANNYTFPNTLLKTLQDKGINSIQSMRYQLIPIDQNQVNHKRLFTGKTNSYNQCYTVRNAFFEPPQTPRSYDDVGKCLSEIKEAFLFRKPAIINTHRIVYVGAINENNRTQNLKKLDQLLKEITNKWGNVEFLTSDELVNIILNSLKE